MGEIDFENLEAPVSGEVDEDGFDWANPGASQETPSEEPVVEEPQAPQRPRDEQGRFLPKEEEPSQEETPEQAPSQFPPDVQALIDRYGGDVNKALAHVVEVARLAGQQGTELGNLRREVEQMRQEQAQADAQYEQEGWDEEFTSLMDEDPAEAAIAAYERLDNNAFARAYAQWQQDDPAGAKIWLSQERKIAEQEVRISQIQETVQPVAQQVTDTSRQAVELEMFKSLVQENPDLPEYIDGINAELAQNKVLYFLAHEGIPAAKKEAIHAAYKLAQARNAATRGDVQQTAAQAQAAASEQALTEAFVASSANAVREQPEETLADIITRGWDDISTSHEWEGPPFK